MKKAILRMAFFVGGIVGTCARKDHTRHFFNAPVV